jgi:tetratricopeptide (TPR) repeat protein
MKAFDAFDRLQCGTRRVSVLTMRIVLLLALVVACASPQTSYDSAAMIRTGRHHELRDRLRRDPRLPSEDAARRAIVLARVLLDLCVYWDAATFEEALAAFEGVHSRDDRVAAELLQARGEVLYWRRLLGASTDWDEVRRPFALAARLRDSIKDTRGIAETTFYLGLISQFTNDLPNAKRAFVASLALARTVDDPLLTSYPLRHLGSLAEDAGDLEIARKLYEESLALRVKSGDAIRLFNARVTLATFYCERLDDCERARPLVVEARRTADALKLRHGPEDVVKLEARLRKTPP